MLETDVGDKICWRQLWDAGVRFAVSCHQHHVTFNIDVGHQHQNTHLRLWSIVETDTLNRHAGNAA